jgi:lipoprotein-releasing system permease protein
VNLVLDVAFTHVRARVRQTLVAVFGVATGVGFSIMMASLMEGSQDDFIRTLVNAQPHITVTDELRIVDPQPAQRVYGAVEIRGLRPVDDRRGIKNPAETVAVLEAMLGDRVAPYVNVRGIVRVAGREFSVSVLGIDPRRDRRVSNLTTQMRQGRIEDLATTANAIIIGSRLAEKIGGRIASRVNIIASNGTTMQAQVVGIFHAGVRSIDEGQIYTLARTAQILSGRTGYVNEIRMRLPEALEAREVARRIETRIPYRATSWQEAQEDLLSSFIVRNIIMYTVVGAILLVASFGTYNIVSTITHEKARDIAIMKSLGLKESTVRSIFVIEGMVIGTTGAVLGWAVGTLLILALGQIEIRNPFLDTTRLPLIWSFRHYAIASAVAIGASVIASYFPARKAASVHPVQIIRGAT